jgi:hypothetical protein
VTKHAHDFDFADDGVSDLFRQKSLLYAQEPVAPTTDNVNAGVGAAMAAAVAFVNGIYPFILPGVAGHSGIVSIARHFSLRSSSQYEKAVTAFCLMESASMYFSIRAVEAMRRGLFRLILGR